MGSSAFFNSVYMRLCPCEVRVRNRVKRTADWRSEGDGADWRGCQVLD